MSYFPYHNIYVCCAFPVLAIDAVSMDSCVIAWSRILAGSIVCIIYVYINKNIYILRYYGKKTGPISIEKYINKIDTLLSCRCILQNYLFPNNHLKRQRVYSVTNVYVELSEYR